MFSIQLQSYLENTLTNILQTFHIKNKKKETEKIQILKVGSSSVEGNAL